MQNLEALQATMEAETKEELTYIKFHREYDLDIKWLHKQFRNKMNNDIIIITGLKKNGRLALLTAQKGYSNILIEIPTFFKKYQIVEIL